ncbi:hypothetical protein Tco_1086121 [Tanacetum coccineum]
MLMVGMVETMAVPTKGSWHVIPKSMMEREIKSQLGTLTKGNEKTKGVEETSKQGGWGNDNKRVKVSKGFMVATPHRNEYVVSHPKCAKCWTHHPEGGLISTDISKITRKPSKNEQTRTRERKSTKEARDAKPKAGKVKKSKLWSTLSQLWVNKVNP